MGNINLLVPGQCLLTQASKTKNADKVQLEFAEVLSVGNSNSITARLNRSDVRFKTRARRAWETVMMKDAAEDFGINLGDDAGWELQSNGKDILPLNILNPQIEGQFIRLQILETQEGDANSGLITDWMRDNVDTAAKRRGADGDFITKNGKHIFSKSRIVFCKEGENPNHVFITEVDSVAATAPTSKSLNITDEVGV